MPQDNLFRSTALLLALVSITAIGVWAIGCPDGGNRAKPAGQQAGAGQADAEAPPDPAATNNEFQRAMFELGFAIGEAATRGR